MICVGSTAGKIKERRLDRMRLGQAVCDYVTLPSDPEIRLAIVPLTEAEYKKALNKVYELQMADDLAGASIKDRVQSQEILVQAIRETDDLSQRVYTDTKDQTAVEMMLDDLEVADVDELIDKYNEMVEKSSPSLDGIPDGEIDAVKKALQVMDWNALSGRSWYALKRFLSTITPEPLLVNSHGSTSTPSATTTSD
jgi:hypothetical protein